MDWRRILIYTHRWLGIAGSLLFIAWFVSGVVLMYVGMPALSSEERRVRIPGLDLDRATVGLSEAAVTIGAAPQRVVIGMQGDRPVYRVSARGVWTTVFADTGEVLDGLSADAALDVARAFAPENAASLSHEQRLVEPDQWTLQSRAVFPLHRIRLGDAADSRLYISERTGEPVMKTTASGRRWAYAGAVLHWLYFTPFRRHSTLWLQSVIWLSIIGCVLTLSGLVWGVWRLSPSKRYRLKRVPAHSPYAGLMHWHHYAGLIFGLVTFTWMLSGGLSLDPWNWHPGNAPTGPQRAAMTGGPLRLGPLTAVTLRAAQAAMTPLDPREMEVLQFRDEPYLTADGLLVSAVHPERGAFERFDDDVMLDAAHAAMPGVRVLDADWLTSYDAYYYSRAGARALPVLRVRYGDPDSTWLYFDPSRGAIALKQERLSRVNRWLYHGLHSLDFPFLYSRRPLWDIVVIGLSAGGLVLSSTTLAAAWRRLRRHARRVRSVGRA